MAPSHRGRGGVQRTLLLAAAVALVVAPSASALYTASSPVLQLEPGNFRQKLKAAGVALVEFYAPWCGHCKVLAPEYEKLAKGLKGMVTVAAVDADAHKDLAQEFGIRGFPTVKLLWMDGDKVKAADYQGQRTAKDILPWVMDKAKSLALKRMGEKSGGGGSKGSKGAGGGGAGAGGGGGGSEDSGFYTGTDVVVLTDGNFGDEVTGSSDLWLVEFYAPWCGHCKNLKPQWIEAATELKGKVKLGAVDCTVHQSTCGEYGVQGYPTIKYFGKRKSSPEDYNGPRESAGIVSWATEKWAKQAPPPEVRELVDAAVWEKNCVGDDEGKGGAALCLVAFLPDILDSKASGRNGYISVLQKVADKYKDRPYSYLWAQGGAQAGLEGNLGVGGFGYPALVAFKPKDKKFITARGAFETQHVVDFLEGLKHGREPVQAVQGTLADIKTTAPWDGKDAVVQLEDEFSLDDLNEL